MHANQSLRRLSILALFGVMTALATFPLSARPGSEAIDLGPDTRLFLWTLAWDTEALAQRPFSLFDANIFHPEPRTLAYSEHQLGSALVAAPIIATSGNPLLAMNTVLLLSCFLSGLGAYVLSRQLGLGQAGALLAGVVFAFTPPRFFRLGQLHLATVQWIPFCLALVHRYAASGTRRHLLGALALFSLQAVTGGQSALFLALAACGLIVYLALFGELRPRSSLVRDAAIGLPLALALNLPFVVPYLLVQRDLGLERSLDEAREWSPNAASFLASPTHVHRWLAGKARLGRALRDAKAFLFPGVIPLFFACFAFARAAPKPPSASVEPMASSRSLRALDALISILALLAVLIEAAGGVSLRSGSFHLSASGGGRAAVGAVALLVARLLLFRRQPFAYLPPLRGLRDRLRAFFERRVGINGGFYALLFALSLWVALGPGAGLYAALYRLLPGFDFIRVPSRFTLLSVLALAVLAGLGFERFVAGRKWLAPAIVALSFAELAAFPLATRPYPIETSPMDQWLAARSDDDAIVALPVSDPRDHVAAARRHSIYMLQSIIHFRPLVNGYSGFTPPGHDRLFRMLVRFPDEDALAAIEALGVRYAVIHRDGYGDESEWKALMERLDGWQDRLNLVASFDQGRVYELPVSVGVP